MYISNYIEILSEYLIDWNRHENTYLDNVYFRIGQFNSFYCHSICVRNGNNCNQNVEIVV